MSKSVYSLVLADDVVQAIDALAAQQGMNRSLLVSHILAEHMSLSTPEMRMQQLLEQLRQSLYQKNMRVFSQSATALTLRTAIRYKYNPALHYTVEMWDTGRLGRVRVSMRSQSEAVKALFAGFFRLWQELDGRENAPDGEEKTHIMEEKRYTRLLRRPAGEWSQQQLGEMVADYVLLLDSCMKAYFGTSQEPDLACQQVQAAYQQHMKRHPVTGQL